MPTLTARVDRDRAAVVLEIDDRENVQALIRTDANGTRPVRMSANLMLGLPGLGPGTFTDYEAALGGWVSYRLEHPKFEQLVWVDLRGSWAPRFVIPSLPMVYATAEIVTAYDAGRKSRATFHDVIGRPDPLVVEGKLSSRRGKLVAQYDTLTDTTGLEEMLRRGTTVMYRQSEHPGMDMYFHTEDYNVSADPETGIWTVTVDYVEIAFPPGAIVSTSGWTFEALTAAHETFTDVALSYESFQHLAMGETRHD